MLHPNNLCNALCSSCVLTIPLCHDQFIVQTDASGKGISGILSVCRNGTELPVAFFSRQLRGAERNYAASELECLAVVEAVQHYQVYLHGRDFTVQTDHRALEHLLSSNKLNGRLARWAMFLQMFKITIRYRPGSANNNADGLSHQAWPENPCDEDITP